MQFLNALTPMEVTLFAIDIEVNDVQYLKASATIAVVPDTMTAFGRHEEQSMQFVLLDPESANKESINDIKTNKNHLKQYFTAYQ